MLVHKGLWDVVEAIWYIRTYGIEKRAWASQSDRFKFESQLCWVSALGIILNKNNNTYTS